MSYISGKADFTQTAGKLKPALHGSNTAPILSSRKFLKYDEEFKRMNFYSNRTHDWALWNDGQRMIDTYYIFPLMHLAAADPKNYYFAPSDEIINMTRNLGGRIFYRLGSSIEHSGDVHFNSLVPEDFDKYAEVLAGIVRHYRKGWANGYEYDDMEYWEIWNEPDLGTNMWTGTREEFVKLFVTVLKRLKSEFPEIKVGGPGLCGFNPDYFTDILNACRAAGVAPDFISWHVYGSDVEWSKAFPQKGRDLLDSLGFHDTEISINEWHYVVTWDGIAFCDSPACRERAFGGETGLGNIDSGVYNLAILSEWHDTPLDTAFYYGARPIGVWGFMTEGRSFNKNFFSMEMFGQIMKDYTTRMETASNKKSIHLLASLSEDGKKANLLVSDYRGQDTTVNIEVKGLENAKYVSAIVLDNDRDNAVTDVTWHNNILTLSKAKAGSAAFSVTFEL